MTGVGPDDELIQIAERQLADAEEAYRLDPSDANQRRIMGAWSVVRRARDAREKGRAEKPSCDTTRVDDPPSEGTENQQPAETEAARGPGGLVR